MNNDSITALIEENPVGVDILPTLEEYVDQQIQDPNLYHFNCNRTILKFYRFQPEKTNVEVVIKILIKGLMNLPESDFLSYLYLIPEVYQQDKTIEKLASLSQLLEICQFQQFWKELAEADSIVTSVDGFKDAIRAYFIGVTEATFQSISVEALKQILNVTGDEEFSTLLNNKQWKVEGDLVIIPLNQQNQHRPQKTASTLRFEQLGSLISC